MDQQLCHHDHQRRHAPDFSRAAPADPKAHVTWHVAMRPGKRRALDKDNEADALIDPAEKLKAGSRFCLSSPACRFGQ